MTLWLVIFTLIGLTFIPGLELRASIPVGCFTPAFRDVLSLPAIVGICVAANVVVGILTFWLMGPVERLVRRWGWFDRVVWPRIARAQHKLHPYVEKYGEWGVAVFIGVPLPGTGAYTGAFGSYLLGLDRRRFWIANALGVVMAAVAVTALCLLIDLGAVGENSWLQRLFLKRVGGASA